MRKLLVVILVLLSACNKKPTTQTTAASGDSDSTHILVEDAIAMVQNYNPNTLDFRVKTRTVWLKMKRIREIYHSLQEDSAANKGTDGLRIYFAKYPARDTRRNPNSHAHQNSIIIVSTKDSIIQVIRNNGEISKKHVHRDYFEGLLKGKEYCCKMVPENKGELCPPGDCFKEGALLLENN